MRGAIFLTAVLLALACAGPVCAATERPVARIDRLTATEKNDHLTIEAQGAVMGGGWTHAALRVTRSTQAGDAHVLVIEFVAEPPTANEAVIPGLLPASAALSLKVPRKGLVSVRVMAGENDITTQILK